MTAARLSSDCPQCGRPLVRKTRRSDGNAFLSCSGWRSGACSFAEDYDARLNELAARVREMEQAAIARTGGIDVGRELRSVIAAAHPDRWPGATELAHLVTTRLNVLRGRL